LNSFVFYWENFRQKAKLKIENFEKKLGDFVGFQSPAAAEVFFVAKFHNLAKCFQKMKKKRGGDGEIFVIFRDYFRHFSI
jgi:hypothetical protein